MGAGLAVAAPDPDRLSGDNTPKIACPGCGEEQGDNGLLLTRLLGKVYCGQCGALAEIQRRVLSEQEADVEKARFLGLFAHSLHATALDHDVVVSLGDLKAWVWAAFRDFQANAADPNDEDEGEG